MRKKRTSVLKYILTLRWLFAAPVLFYKKCVSPFLPSRCPYYPTCSSYMLESISRHGPVIGVFYGIWRLLRCNPFTKGGLDPVPFKKGDYKWVY
jgi:putative membrane protein insertion efficiency factor